MLFAIVLLFLSRPLRFSKYHHVTRRASSPENQLGYTDNIEPKTAPERDQRTRSILHVINLTNGIELLPLLFEYCGASTQSVGFCRVQSSHCERCDFAAVLREMDHGILTKLALGEVIIVHDCGSRDMQWPQSPQQQESKSSTRISVPRAIWWGLEWIRYALRESWNLADDENGGEEAWFFRGYNVQKMLSSEYKRLPKNLKKRLKYYREIVKAAGTTDVLLYGASQPTDRDGQADWYAETLAHELTNPTPQGSQQHRDFVPYTHKVIGSKYGEVLAEMKSLVEESKEFSARTNKAPMLIPPGSHLFCANDFVGVGRSEDKKLEA